MKQRESKDSATDHAYFQALEAAFIRLRGAPLLLSPADWQVAKSWRGQGIPLELVVRVMERIFERQAESDAKTGIKSLRYFKTAVKRSWDRVLELGAGDRSQAGDGSPDVAVLLERLSRAFPVKESFRDVFPESSKAMGETVAKAIEGVPERIARMSGAVPEIEGALQRLDREMMDRLRKVVDPEALAEVVVAAEENLASLAERLTPEDRRRTLELMVRQRLRKQYKLPVLSLFSPDAGTPDRT